MIREAILKLTNKEDLGENMAYTVMDEIMEGKASHIQIGAFLTALSMKGETIDEIVACAKSMRSHATKLLNDKDVLEIVGTGGDKSNSFNISTTSAIVLSSMGVPIAKHGNRAASSKCGAADVLEALGVKIDVTPEKSMEMLGEIGICFLFAPIYHGAMKNVAPVRKELQIRTIFNILGPLSNPLGASMQLMGVYDESLVEPLSEVLTKLGVKSGMVVFGTDGLDEISVSAPTKVCEIRDGWFKSYEINPTDFGMKLHKKEDLLGGTAEENAKITREILSGAKGAKRDAVVLNSAAALYIARSDLTLEQAIKETRNTLDSGKALDKLEAFIKASNS